MFLTVWTCVAFALAVNRLVFGRRPGFELGTRDARRNGWAVLKT